jgi:N-dimethylarginine dimethylaminohydrolase
MVFTANAGLVHGQRFFSARFRHPERQGESPAYERWFAQHDHEVRHLPGHHAFEGEGDALWLGDMLVCGHGFRTDPEAPTWLAASLDCKVLSLKLVDPHFYHLDTCFCPLREGEALWHPPAFSVEGQRRLQELASQLIAVPAEEARRFACNAVVIGSQVLIPAGCPQTCQLLQERGFACHSLPMDEFIKAGGACKCLVLRLPAR